MHEFPSLWTGQDFRSLHSEDNPPYTSPTSFISQNRPRFDTPTSVSALLSLQRLKNQDIDSNRSLSLELSPIPSSKYGPITPNHQRRCSSDPFLYSSTSSPTLRKLDYHVFPRTPISSKKRPFDRLENSLFPPWTAPPIFDRPGIELLSPLSRKIPSYGVPLARLNPPKLNLNGYTGNVRNEVQHRTPTKKVYVQKACVNCKHSHVACDASRPCQRCVHSGKGDSCIDAQRKKRGRPSLKLDMKISEIERQELPTKLVHHASFNSESDLENFSDSQPVERYCRTSIKSLLSTSENCRASYYSQFSNE
ncbi:hypothetical protein K7432_004766 [Basidiobolus ranarum]|uniref:Zn(2)-C6 fungal-type domain-containing protein n=1 Tax=Basidiobolus ranarum TaxID=34480 RepID=A0ABR2WXM1_9FUNG